MEKNGNDALSDVAYRYILERIISFEYKPNEPIIENDLCEKLKISRTPLREALRRLEAEGFVTKVKNRGTFVRTYTAEDISESCDIRSLFEVYSLKKCIKNVSGWELEKVKTDLENLNDDSSAEEYYRTDTELHSMITKYCMNTRMLTIMNNLSVQLDAFQRISAQTPNRLIRSKEEHLKIIKSIEEKNLPEAVDALEAHLENVKESSIRAFQKMRIEKMGI